MDPLEQPDIVARAEALRAENERLLQQLRHHQDEALNRQRMYAGLGATMWLPMNPLAQNPQDVGGLQQALGALEQGIGIPGLGGLLGPGDWNVATQSVGFRDPEAEARYAAEQKERREREQAALARALDLLREKIGWVALAKIQAGGGYKIRSKHWPTVVYLVPRDPHAYVRVLDSGSLVTEVCIVSTDNGLPWPDVMLHRITAIETDESILFATGVVHPRHPARRFDRLRRLFR